MVKRNWSAGKQLTSHLNNNTVMRMLKQRLFVIPIAVPECARSIWLLYCCTPRAVKVEYQLPKSAAHN
jgi:hypothetical protein